MWRKHVRDFKTPENWFHWWGKKKWDQENSSTCRDKKNNNKLTTSLELLFSGVRDSSVTAGLLDGMTKAIFYKVEFLKNGENQSPSEKQQVRRHSKCPTITQSLGPPPLLKAERKHAKHEWIKQEACVERRQHAEFIGDVSTMHDGWDLRTCNRAKTVSCFGLWPGLTPM